MSRAPGFREGPDLPGMNTQIGSNNPASKLRSSCDLCTSLKIRCNKQKPTCEKCESLNANCVYSPYRWKGRPSIPNGVAAFSLSPTAMLTAESLLSSASFTLPTLPANDDNFVTGMGISFDDGFPGMSVDLNAMSPWSPASPIAVQNGSQETRSCNSDASGPTTHRQDKDASTPPMLSQMVTGYQSQSHHMSAPTSRHVCLDTALQILCELHGLPSEDIISSEEALKINRLALQRMDHILCHNCNTCTSDSNIGLLLYTISSRMLTRYQTIFECISQQDWHAQAHHPVFRNQASPPCETLRFQPVQFGGFNVDLPAARYLNLQLLLFELRNMEKFLDTLAGYMERRGMRPGRDRSTSNTQEDPKSRPSTSTVSEAFHKFLSQSVDNLCTEIQLSRQGQNG